MWLSLSILLLIFNIYKIKSQNLTKLIIFFQLFVTILSTPAFSNFLTTYQESVIDESNNACFNDNNSVTLVILGGGIDHSKSEFIMTRLQVKSYRRLVSAFELYIKNKNKVSQIILSGGYGYGNKEADVMSYMLKQLGVSKELILIDNLSHNTYENAQNVSEILSNRGLGDVVLVTSALHMKRAAFSFKVNGVNVCQYPVDSIYIQNSNFIPQVNALYKTKIVIREIIGDLIYRLRY